MTHTLAQPISNLLSAAGVWFLHSGIQDAAGGVARFYRSDLGRNARVSNEITGYAVSTLLFFHQRLGQDEYLEAALRSAHFLTRTAWNPHAGVFPFEHSLDQDHARPLAYFFDTGIIIRGLLAAWRVSGEAEFRDIALTSGQVMLADFRTHDGIHPILSLPQKSPLPHASNWSSAPGCYQLKSALAWHELFEITGEACFIRAYESVLYDALRSEHNFLPGETDANNVMDRLHAYAYFLEGLLPVLDREDCARAFRTGIGRIAKYLDEIGPMFVRSDVYAQLLRLRVYGSILGAIELDQEAAAREAHEAATFQLPSEDPRVSNGFFFGRRGNQLLPYVNPISTAFCVQALALWEDHKNNRPDYSPLI
jgi:hypothetical protein